MGAIHSTDHDCVLETQLGSLKGIEKRNKSGKPIYRRYTKIPYALPPIEDLRWRRPQPLPETFRFDTLSGAPGDYTQFGPICPQPTYNESGALIDNPDAGPAIDNVQDENCLFLNIWVPVGDEEPASGWPVEFYIHGGWLQIGNANQTLAEDPFDLFAESTPRIIVSATHRLNVFGFLGGEDLASSKEDPAPSNFGFWDQRCALEWTAKHIHLFNGNPDNITVGGLSAGANSTFFQIYYDTYLPASQRLIKRIFLRSNAVAIQPSSSTASVATNQFNDLCSIFSIPLDESASLKLSQLRKIPAQSLVEALSKLKIHTFRASTDSDFIPSTFLSSIHSGTFSQKLREHDVGIFMSEVCDERQLYKLINPPSSYSSLLTELSNYYPKHVVEEALIPLYDIPDKSETDQEPWAEVFSKIVGDLQVHASERGLTRCLLNPTSEAQTKSTKSLNFQRHRIEWRAKSLDQWINPAVGVCHAADTPIWFASGWRMGFSREDKEKALAFLEPFGKFLQGEPAEEEVKEDEYTLLDPDGNIHKNVKDDLWDRGLEVWDAVWAVQKDRIDYEFV